MEEAEWVRSCVGGVEGVDLSRIRANRPLGEAFSALSASLPASPASRADRASVLTRSLINVNAEPTRDHLPGT